MTNYNPDGEKRLNAVIAWHTSKSKELEEIAIIKPLIRKQHDSSPLRFD